MLKVESRFFLQASRVVFERQAGCCRALSLKELTGKASFILYYCRRQSLLKRGEKPWRRRKAWPLEKY
jgi:hypothetical protein